MDQTFTLLVVFGTMATGAFLVRRIIRQLRTGNRHMDMHGFAASLSSASKSEKGLDPAVTHALNVVAAYGNVLERVSSPGVLFHAESLLPYSKSEIRDSIELLLLAELDETRRNHLEVADVVLNNFIPDDEYKAIHKQQDGLSQALQMVHSGERDAQKLAKVIVEGTSSETDSLLEEIQHRVSQGDLATLRQHRALRLVAQTLKKRGG